MLKILSSGSFFLALIASPAFGQFSQKDYADLQAEIGEPESISSGVRSMVNPSSAEAICTIAKDAYDKKEALSISKSDMSALKVSAESLLPDTKDQFETAAEYETRQSARRTAWVAEHRFFILPTAVSSGTDVYNADTQFYTLGPSGGGLELSPGGWGNRYANGPSIVGINLVSNFPKLEAQMLPLQARQFFERSADYELVYVAEPLTPYSQSISSYSKQHRLLMSVACRFVRTKIGQIPIYFVRP